MDSRLAKSSEDDPLAHSSEIGGVIEIGDEPSVCSQAMLVK
jgi:hypothetical protein